MSHWPWKWDWAWSIWSRAARIRRLLKRIASIRRQLATELGIYSAAGARDRQFDAQSPRVRLFAQGSRDFALRISAWLRVGPALGRRFGDKGEKIDGIPTREPAFGIPAVWISPDRVEEARRAGYTVVDTISIIGHALGRNSAPLRARIVLPSGGQESARPGERRQLQSGGGFGAKIAFSGESCRKFFRTCCENVFPSAMR